ncbi:hypothetical protein [Nitrolancea hollandica]|uniref:Uncharacterized protein n=1 Tax=Nitrolancea hollandica Lb TaxID=1129897 RepID=I4EFY4_9BACT|nr:hypothetical protein [Nitrolancea hollandica]CCF83596.1 hypothetical protein NITHO_2500003 [Nitrolancea hollandica Lb]
MGTPGYSREFAQQRTAEEAERQRQLEEQQRENARIRERYLQGLEGEREAARRKAADDLEAELAPHKEQEKRAWLIDHPVATAADFERVWPLIRDEKYTGFHARLQREIAAQRAKYGRAG